VIKSRLKHSTMSALLLGVLTMLPARTFGQSQGVVAHWVFDETIGATTRDSVSGTADPIEGYVKRVPGVSGNGLRLDGISTHIVRPGKDAPIVRDGVTWKHGSPLINTLGTGFRLPSKWWISRPGTFSAWMHSDI